MAFPLTVHKLEIWLLSLSCLFSYSYYFYCTYCIVHTVVGKCKKKEKDLVNFFFTIFSFIILLAKNKRGLFGLRSSHTLLYILWYFLSIPSRYADWHSIVSRYVGAPETSTLLKDRTIRSRVRHMALGSRCSVDQGMAFMSEFQKMRTTVRYDELNVQTTWSYVCMYGWRWAWRGKAAPAMVNRQMRREAKKSKKGGRSGGKGLGA